MKSKILKFLVPPLLILSSAAQGQDLYIDFATGRDTNSGISKEAAWKHAPGDPSAQDKARGYSLAPGDVVHFKGGIDYRGSITVTGSGSRDKPITFRGNDWGDTPAMIDGTKALELKFSACPSRPACYGNPNWQKLYIAKIKGELDPLSLYFLGKNRLWLARSPNQPDPFWFDDIRYYSELDRYDSGQELTSSYLKAGSKLADLQAADWDNALVAVWMRPNVVLMRNVQKIDPENGTVFFDPVRNKPYTDRNSYYAFFNRPSDVDQAGEYAIDNIRKTLLLWPQEALHLEQSALRTSDLPVAFDINGNGNITIEGFTITGFSGGLDGWNQGTAILNTANGSENLVIRHNLIQNLRSAEGVGAIQLNNARHILIEDNVITDNEKSSGIRFGKSSDIIVRNNVIDRIGRTGIRLIGTENSEISGNRLSAIRGGHGNGISVYLQNRNILVASNIIEDSPRAFTYHGTGKPGEAENMWLLNNIFLGRVDSWGKKFSSVYFLHNLIFAPDDRKKSLRISGKEPKTTMVNNIIDGFLNKPPYRGWDMSHNIYTSLSWSQSPKNHWYMGDESEVDGGLADKIRGFRDGHPPTDLLPGKNISSYLPVEKFKSFDFSYWQQARPVGPAPRSAP